MTNTFSTVSAETRPLSWLWFSAFLQKLYRSVAVLVVASMLFLTGTATSVLAQSAITPASGPLSDATVNDYYQTSLSFLSGSGFVTIWTTIEGSLPPGLQLMSGSGGITSIVGTPTTPGTYQFTVRAIDLRFSVQALATYTIIVKDGLPVVGAVAATVAANSSDNPVALDISGEPATYVSVATQPSRGTATASGTTITYTPTAGYAGSDSFTYTASNNAGTSTAATVTMTITAPPPSISPQSGVLREGTVDSLYYQTLSPSGFNSFFSSINWSVSSGHTPPGVQVLASVENLGTIIGKPTTAGTYQFTVKATDGRDPTITASASYTIVVRDPVLSADVATTTVAANSSDNPVTLNITGGTPTSVAVATQATHGTATASGTSITYKPVAGFSGRDSFTYTATNGAGTSAAATLTIIVEAPTLAFSPAAGTLAAGTIGTAYTNLTFTASNGTAPYTYTAHEDALPPGLTLTPGGVLTGTPTASGSFSFKVKATDKFGATGTAIYSLAVGGQLPVANTVITKVAANSSDNKISLYLTGGTATSVTVATAASHGTAKASGTSITYTPAAGYTGTDSFTYTATNSAGTSAAATVSITVAATSSLTLSPEAGALTAGTVGTAYTSQTFSASKGTAPYIYKVTSGALPSGLTLAFGGTLTGTPTVSGSFSFTVTAIDANGTKGTAAYTLAVNARAALVLSPEAGTLTAGTVGTAYTGRTITASNGTAPYTYKVTSGALPSGLTLTSGGVLSGTPTAKGSSSFTVTATDANGATGTAAYTMTVNAAAASFVFTPASGSILTEAMIGEEYAQPISAKGGSGALIYNLASGTLPEGVVLNVSTGQLTGPLSSNAKAKDYSFTIGVRDNSGLTGTANYTLTAKPREVTVTDKVVNVEPGATPADVYLNRGATGGPFTSADTTFVEPPSAGTAKIIRGQLAAAGPVGTPVGWYLQFTPNPAYAGEVRIGYRLTSALGISNTGTVTYKLSYDPAEVAADIDNLVHGFVRSRQNMIASTIKVPSLLERRQMEQATEVVTARMIPSERGMTASFSTSLAQMESARDAADGVAGGYASPFNIWIDGAFLAHNDKDINGDKWGTFAMINAGADYLLSDKALLGLSFHYDRMTDPTDEDAELTGNGWMAGPYASFEVGKGVFWNASLLYGGSSNTIDTALWDGTFDTTRWMADTSIEGQWMIDEATSFTPKLRALYFSEKVEDYQVKNSAGDVLGIDGFDEKQFRVSLGAEIARSFTLENGSKLTPKLGLTGGFSGLDGAGAFGSITAGLTLQTADQWMLDAGLLFNLENEGEKSVGGRVRASKRF